MHRNKKHSKTKDESAAVETKAPKTAKKAEPKAEKPAEETGTREENVPEE